VPVFFVIDSFTATEVQYFAHELYCFLALIASNVVWGCVIKASFVK